MSIYITGDPHGDYTHIRQFCRAMGTTKDDVLIVLGDAGLNYFGGNADHTRKQNVSQIPITQFLIHGNHEMRPGTIESYHLEDWHGGHVWKEDNFPKLLFAQDGDIFELAGKKILVIGGAYSVDKEVRLRRGYQWFADEQPSEEIKQHVEENCEKTGWKVDVVLSHTCPERFIPTEAFLHGYDQSKVDQSTEKWLGEIEERLDYQEWYCGHYHINKKIDKLQFLFHDIRLFSGKEA